MNFKTTGSHVMMHDNHSGKIMYHNVFANKTYFHNFESDSIDIFQFIERDFFCIREIKISKRLCREKQRDMGEYINI